MSILPFLASAVLSVAAAPDLLITHARLFLDNEKSDETRDAIAISGGRISAVGASRVLESLADTHTRRLDAHGRIVVPGFIDSHIHFVSGGAEEDRIVLDSAQSLADIQGAVRAFAKAHPEAPWILGRGWSYDLFYGMPTRQMLDAAEPTRPVFLRAYDGHTGWANSAALLRFGLTKASKDPKDGSIAREADGVTPAGALLEGALDVALDALPKATPAERLRHLAYAQRLALAAGITTINELGSDADLVDTYLSAESSGALVVKTFFSPAIETPIETIRDVQKRLAPAKKIRFGSLKGFVDGVVESATAAMLAPYADNPKVSGKAHLEATDLDRMIQPLDKEGMSVSLHCIGDRGVRLALDAYERAAKKNGTQGLRHRIEHIEVLDPADAKRFSELGVIASMQPLHSVPSDSPGKGAWETKVGPKRLPYAWAWHSLLAAKAPLAFGSDWNVMSLDPLMGLAVATSRKNGHGLPKDGWWPGQKISFHQALDAYTRGAAYGLHAENDRGSIAVGLAADLAVLSAKVSPDEPLSLYWGSVDVTLIDGAVVYER